MKFYTKSSFLNGRNLTTVLIFLAVILGFAAGVLAPDFMLSIRWIGDVFFNLLKSLVLPLIFTALVSAITSMGDLKKLGSMGKYTFIYIFANVSVAVIIGLSLFNFLKPGVGIDPVLILGNELSHSVPKSLEFHEVIVSFFPPNILEAAVKFEVMPIVFFALMFSIACAACGEQAKPVSVFFTSLRNIFVKMIGWVIALSPIGVFSLLGTGIAMSVKNGHFIQDLKGLLAFVSVFFLGLTLQFLVQLLAVKYFTRKVLKNLIRDTAPAVMTAFATSSSLATLPVAMASMEKMQLKDEVIKFVLPLTAAINLAGTVMYEASAAIFFSQILGYDLSFSHQVIIFFTAIIAGMGASGIPESGLITMVTVLRAVNIPVSAISLLLPLDRILDRFRTMLNIWGDMCCANIINEFVLKGEKRQRLTEATDELELERKIRLNLDNKPEVF